MDLARLENGPWKVLFEGKFQEYFVKVLSNPHRQILVVISEENGATQAVVQGYSVFYTEGKIEKFVETLPKSVNIWAQHSEGSTISFLLIASEPQLVELSDESFPFKVTEILEEANLNSQVILNVSKAYESNLVPLEKASTDLADSFFSQPLLAPAISTQVPKTKLVQTSESQASFEEILLGLTREKKLVEEPTQLFKRTIISGGEEKYRKHLAQILIEGMLMSNLPVTVFEWDYEFDGLSSPTPKLDELKQAGISMEPIGFPIKKFISCEDIKVDLNLMNSKGFCEIFGINKEQFAEFLKNILSEKKFNSLDELIESIKSRKPTPEFNQYQINRFIRILLLLKNHYPNLFGGENPVKELTKEWGKVMGRAGLVKLGKLKDDKSRILLLHSLLKGILKEYEEKGVTKKIRATILIPKVEKIVSVADGKLLQQEIVSFLNEFEKYGVCYIIETKNRVDLPNEIPNNSKVFLSIISGLDVGVKIENRKQYRISIRPSLSTVLD